MTDTQTDKLYDHHRQQLSAMLDGELPPDQAKFMLRRLEHDRELATCWERWQVCGDILRGRHDALLPADFSRRVASAIAGGEQMAGTTESSTAVATKPPRWARWGGGAALAASVAMAALFVGRQAPEIDQESTTAPVQVVAGTTSAPAPTPTIPAAPSPAPDAATTLAAAVAVAEVPRRAIERRSSRSQGQRAAARNRQQAAAPLAVAASANVPLVISNDARPAVADAGMPTMTIASDPFAAQPAPTRPWPRAILPNFPADGAFTASYGSVAGTVVEHPFHPFEPRIELQQPAAADDRATGSGPR